MKKPKVGGLNKIECAACGKKVNRPGLCPRCQDARAQFGKGPSLAAGGR